MAFKASNKRERKTREPVSVGSLMRPSAAIRSWYRQQMDSVCASMMKDYKESIGVVLEGESVKQFFAKDASAASAFKKVLDALNSKWGDIFRGFAKVTSENFVRQSDDYAKSSTIFGMTTAGIEQPIIQYNENIANTLNAAQDFNNTLIAGIQADVHEKIYNAVMLSLTSPKPEEQGQAGILSALKEAGGFAKDRAKLIARDQTSKLYSSLSDERMIQNGVEEFEWMHSSAGKVPRQTHLDRDGQIFKVNDPRLWEGPKSDQGPPGWAINCRCARRIVIR